MSRRVMPWLVAGWMLLFAGGVGLAKGPPQTPVRRSAFYTMVSQAANMVGGNADRSAARFRTAGDFFKGAGLDRLGWLSTTTGNALELFFGTETLRSASLEVSVGASFFPLRTVNRIFPIPLDKRILGFPLQYWLGVNRNRNFWTGSLKDWDEVAAGREGSPHLVRVKSVSTPYFGSTRSSLNGVDERGRPMRSVSVALNGFSAYSSEEAYGFGLGFVNVLGVGLGHVEGRTSYLGVGTGIPLGFFNVGAGLTVYYRPLTLLTQHLRKPSEKIQALQQRIESGARLVLRKTVKKAGVAIKQRAPASAVQRAMVWHRNLEQRVILPYERTKQRAQTLAKQRAGAIWSQTIFGVRRHSRSVTR